MLDFVRGVMVERRIRGLSPNSSANSSGFVEDLLKQTGGDKTAPIALICRTGNRTTQVQRYLEAEGFTRVYNVKEGMAGSAAGPGWVKRGLPLEDCRSC